jgi:hypothetical protein
MALHLEETEDPNTEETTYELQDEEGNTVVNLTELMDGNLSEVEDHDDYFVGRTFDDNEYECEVIFNEKGRIIISPTFEHTYISERDEFIVSVNGSNNVECYENTFSYDDTYYGVIDFYGDFIIPPKYTSIEYDDTFDLYIVESESYFMNGEYIGDVCGSEVDNCLIFKKNKKFGILDKGGVILNPIYTSIQESNSSGILFLYDGNKYGLFDINSGSQPDCKFDEIIDGNIPEFLDKVIYKVKLGHQYGLIDEQGQLLFDDLFDGIDDSSFILFNNSNGEGKPSSYMTFIVWHHNHYWFAEINEDTSTHRKCQIQGSSSMGLPYDYLSLEIATLGQGEDTFFLEIYVGYIQNGMHRKFEFRVFENNKFINSEHRAYKHCVYNDFVILNLDDNLCGGLFIGNRHLLERTPNACVIQFNYNKIETVRAKHNTIIGIIGIASNYLSVYEPIQFHELGRVDTYEKALDILNKFYTEIYK